jgi:uncharacterized membrane protein
VRAVTRIGISIAIGLAVIAVLAWFAPWEVSALLGWDAAALVFVVWIWIEIGGRDASTTKRIATREDDSRRAAELIVLGACVASLGGVGMLLIKASEATGFARSWLTALAVGSVMVSWLAVNTVFTLRYAHLYFLEGGGIDFHADRAPDYGDFAYLAFTVGMTYQVSDTDLVSKAIRKTCLRHALVAYLFGIVIVAMTINVVASLLRG